MKVQRRFAAFDIDGTLIRWQLFHAIVKQLVAHEAISPHDYATMEELFDKWKSRSAPDAFHTYENALLATWAAILQHIPYDAYIDAAETAFTEHKDYVYRYTRDLITTLKKKGFFMIAISGSQQEAIDKIADYYGFDVAIGSKWPAVNGSFTGERISPVDDKGKALQAIVADYNLTFTDSWAVGDSGGDSKMLALVQNPIAFNPDQNLLSIATTHKWPIVIERKNVIYQLTASQDAYQLVV